MGDPADLGIALHSQQGENQTLSIVGTLLWLFTWFLHFFPNSFLITFDLVFFTDPPCLIHES